MAKKKEKKIFNIDEINIEIDYNKLAETIVAAQNKQTTQYSVTREWMKIIIIPVFWGIAVITSLLGIVFTWQGGKTLVEAIKISAEGWIKDAFIGIFGFFLGLLLVGIAIFTGACAKEVDKENDKNFVVAVFSGMVSLVALVVSFIALVWGVG